MNSDVERSNTRLYHRYQLATPVQRQLMPAPETTAHADAALPAGPQYYAAVPKSSPDARKVKLNRKRLTNPPFEGRGFVLQCPDDRKNRVVSTQATYTSGSSAVSG